ncbi:MAG TPA: ammonium transporter [Acidobacteriota bacterium]|nr:ammonium transporter [Acidobacteriota bacterium]
MTEPLQNMRYSADALFLMIGAVMIFSMHAGFAFLEAGSVRTKNQVNALVKIFTDWSVSTVTYFLIGFPIAYGISFWMGAGSLMNMMNGSAADGARGFDLLHCFFLTTFAACIPAIISGGIAERARFWPQVVAGGVFTGFAYPLFESIVWGRVGFFQNWIKGFSGVPFHDFAGSVVVHSMGGWLALPAIILLGQRLGRWVGGKSVAIPASNIPYLSLGSWILAIGWFGFNVMSAQRFEGISGLVAANSLFAMVGGVLFAILFSRNDPGFAHNGALAGLIAICAGSDIVHPFGAFFIGGIGSLIFIYGYKFETEKLKIDDVLGVWPLHGVAGSWGGIAAGIFGAKTLGGVGGVSFLAQLTGTLTAIGYASMVGTVVYFALKHTIGIRLTKDEELRGSDISVHRVSAYPELELGSSSQVIPERESALHRHSPRLGANETVAE